MSAQANLAGMFPPTEAMRWSCHLIWSGFIIFIIVFSLPLRRWDGSLLIYALIVAKNILSLNSNNLFLPSEAGLSSFALEFVFLIIALMLPPTEAMRLVLSSLTLSFTLSVSILSRFWRSWHLGIWTQRNRSSRSNIQPTGHPLTTWMMNRITHICIWSDYAYVHITWSKSQGGKKTSLGSLCPCIQCPWTRIGDTIIYNHSRWSHDDISSRYFLFQLWAISNLSFSTVFLETGLSVHEPKNFSMRFLAWKMFLILVCPNALIASNVQKQLYTNCQVMEGKEMKEILESHSDLLDYISKHSGRPMTSVLEVEFVENSKHLHRKPVLS